MSSQTERPINLLLDRLDSARPYGKGYRADCPQGHRSRGSLSIKEADDGRVLLHCFSGCSAIDVVHSLDLTFADLFERPVTALMTPEDEKRFRHTAKMRQSREAIKFLPLEVTIVEMAATQLANFDPLTEADHERMILAGERIRKAKAVLCGR